MLIESSCVAEFHKDSASDTSVLRDRDARSVAVEDPAPSIQSARIQAAGVVAQRVPVDAEGIVVDRLNRIDANAVLSRTSPSISLRGSPFAATARCLA